MDISFFKKVLNTHDTVHRTQHVQLSLNLFLGGLPRRYEEGEGPCKLNACRFTIDTEKKRCVEVRRTDLSEG